MQTTVIGFYAGCKTPAFFLLLLIMAKEQWHPIHYAIIFFGICMLCMVYQISEYKKCKQLINNKYNQQDTLLIEQSHEFDFE